MASSSARRCASSCSESLPSARLRRHAEVIVVGLVGAVGEPVADRLGVGPEPGQRPQQAAEDQRQQAQRVDRLGLRMMPLVGDLLGHHVDDPEQRDDEDRHHDEDEPRDVFRHVSIISGGRNDACAASGNDRAAAAPRRPWRAIVARWCGRRPPGRVRCERDCMFMDRDPMEKDGCGMELRRAPALLTTIHRRSRRIHDTRYQRKTTDTAGPLKLRLSMALPDFMW